MPRAITVNDDMRDRVRLDGGRRGKRGGREPGLAMRIGGRLMALAWQSPKDALALLLATAAVVAILVNALLLQTGRHPSPLFGTVSALPPAVVSPMPRARPVEAEKKAPPVEMEKKAPEPAPRAAAKPSPAPQAAVRPPAAVPQAQTRSDPVGDLIVSTRRLAVVQRVLADYGYGQFKAMGVMNAETQAAIERFERERRMPVTGQMSDRLVRELALVTGRSID